MRKGKFCPKCGRTVDVLYEGLCKDCFKELMSPSEIPEKLTVGTCKMCGYIYLGEKKFDTVEQAVESFLQEILEQKEIKSATYRIANGNLFVTISMKADDVEKEIEKRIDLVNKAITCRFCNLKKSSFYNATIQLRSPKEMEDKLLSDIERKMQELSRDDNYAFISGTEKLKEGIDLLVGSKDAAGEVAKFMKNKYNAKIKISRKLSGLMQGKKVYRDTILISISD
jgi:nonsense-mediated mRNA decay protein 3